MRGHNYVPQTAHEIIEKMACRIGRAFRLANTDLYRIDCKGFDAEIVDVANVLSKLGRKLRPHLGKSQEATHLLDLLATLAISQPGAASAVSAMEAQSTRNTPSEKVQYITIEKFVEVPQAQTVEVIVESVVEVPMDKEIGDDRLEHTGLLQHGEGMGCMPSQFEENDKNENIVMQQLSEDSSEHLGEPQREVRIGCVEKQTMTNATTVASLDGNTCTHYELPAPRFREYVQKQWPESSWMLSAATHWYDYGWFAKLPQHYIQKAEETGLSNDLLKLQKVFEDAQKYESEAKVADRGWRAYSG